MPGPDNTEFDASLLVIDKSAGSWNIFPTTAQPTETGFVNTFTSPSGGKFDMSATFEKSAEAIKCKVQWAGAEPISGGFGMLVVSIPFDMVANAHIVSGSKVIDIPKLNEGVNLRNHIVESTSFALGPVEGRQWNFDFETPVDVQVVILGGGDFLHLRLILTPGDAGFPADGEVVWKFSWEAATEPPIATEP